jgi:hypothetical protein
MEVHARQSSKPPHAVLTTLIQKGQLTEHGQHSLAHDENSEDLYVPHRSTGTKFNTLHCFKNSFVSFHLKNVHFLYW